ncbi:hypothetical protein DM02DRAFT_425446 [Periconia macrospinosa]|uniref:Uncharacterized protein n=1 Tax=Periconia macrospinosa TaxID=97972 RepID=A0A2V1EBC9_9PLEO|nr:hypothetical protein DM02DRAFT_425446 [Periconia macrospinosa]
MYVIYSLHATAPDANSCDTRRVANAGLSCQHFLHFSILSFIQRCSFNLAYFPFFIGWHLHANGVLAITDTHFIFLILLDFFFLFFFLYSDWMVTLSGHSNKALLLHLSRAGRRRNSSLISRGLRETGVEGDVRVLSWLLMQRKKATGGLYTWVG